MARVAILGGGIAGLAAAYECEQQRRAGKPVDWHLYEAAGRFGGTVQTTRRSTESGEWVLEGGPDAWLTEKRWAEELARELGLGDQLITSNDADKVTYIAFERTDAAGAGRHLVAMPPHMRMMVPEDLASLAASSLFSDAAKQAYADELANAGRLKEHSPFADELYDESVAHFVRRHFGGEVLAKIGAPLLSGVFGGDTERLSVRAVMAPFVAMEQEHGSLIAALQARKAAHGERQRPATFTTLRDGMGALVDALVASLPGDRLHLGTSAAALRHQPAAAALGGQPSAVAPWLVRFAGEAAHACAVGYVPFDAVLCALPVDAAHGLLADVDAHAAALVPTEASSAVLVTFCWSAAAAATFAVPPGFGFLVPQTHADEHGSQHDDKQGSKHDDKQGSMAPAIPPHLLAATFTDQKFPARVPPGCRAVRVFFGTGSAEAFEHAPDEHVAALALEQLRALLGPLPPPDAALPVVIRWPRSLPQYELGHPARMRELEAAVTALPGLALLGNGYRGVGVPDLVRDARAAAREQANTVYTAAASPAAQA